MRWLSISIVVSMLTAFVFSTTTTAQDETFVLPEPTGNFQIGTTTFHWVDETRDELMTDDPADKREGRVRIWYPAEVGTDANPEAYIPNFEIVWEYLAAALSFTVTATEPYLANAVSHSFADASVSDALERYPVVLFSHGAVAIPEAFSVWFEELASHGYIVVSITHPYAAGVTLFPDGRIATYDPQFTEGLLEGGDSLVGDRDVIFVLDELKVLNDTDSESVVAGRMDLDNIGIFGYSWGGGVAAQVALSDDRIKAGIIIDAPLTPEVRQQGLAQPFMYMQGTFGLFQLFANSGGAGYLLRFDKVDGYNHNTFSDCILWPEIQFGSCGLIDGRYAAEMNRAYILAFFDEYLKGQPQPLLDGPSEEFPELEIESRNTE